MSIKAGDLRRKITLKKPVNTLDIHNRRTTGFEPAATVWSARADVSGREFYQAHGVHAEDVVTYTIRWRDDIAVTWRIDDHGCEYNILEINHLGYMRDYLRIKARQVARGGA